MYAAGLDKVIVSLPDKGIIERWDLAKGEREIARPIKSVADVYWNCVLLGSGSRGPLIANGTILDLDTLRPLSVHCPDVEWISVLNPAGERRIHWNWP